MPTFPALGGEFGFCHFPARKSKVDIRSSTVIPGTCHHYFLSSTGISQLSRDECDVVCSFEHRPSHKEKCQSNARYLNIVRNSSYSDNSGQTNARLPMSFRKRLKLKYMLFVEYLGTCLSSYPGNKRTSLVSFTAWVAVFTCSRHRKSGWGEER